MFASISTFGLFHIAVSVLPIFLGLFAFLRDGKIDPGNRIGKLYVLTMLLGSVSSWGFLPSKGFTPGQVLTLVTLALLLAGTLTLRGAWRRPGYVQTVSLSASYLLLMVFATTETLTRLPIGNPFASGPADPALLPVRLVLLAGFVLGLGYQLLRLRTAQVQQSMPKAANGPRGSLPPRLVADTVNAVR
jgi:hypothetical protein